MNGKKYCIRCQQTKSQGDFRFSKTRPDGLSDICECCDSAVDAALKFIDIRTDKLK